MGRWCTVLRVLISIGTAYLVMQFLSIMDYVQALFSFFTAPLFGTVLLGMLWKRATPAAGFWGLLAGTLLRHAGDRLAMQTAAMERVSDSLVPLWVISARPMEPGTAARKHGNHNARK
jgi:Na+/proline symporter